MHQQWKGGDILHHPGGGLKVNLLKEAVKEYKDDKDLVIMFTDRLVKYLLLQSLHGLALLGHYSNPNFLQLLT